MSEAMSYVCVKCGFKWKGRLKKIYCPGCESAKTPAQDRPTDEQLLAFGYAPGKYYSKCYQCKTVIGDLDKRAPSCRPCAVKLFQAKRTRAIDTEIPPIDQNVFATNEIAMAGALHDLIYEQYPASENNELSDRNAPSIILYLEAAGWKLVKVDAPPLGALEALERCAEEAEAAIECMGPHGELVRSVQLSVYKEISRVARAAIQCVPIAPDVKTKPREWTIHWERGELPVVHGPSIENGEEVHVREIPSDERGEAAPT